MISDITLVELSHSMQQHKLNQYVHLSIMWYDCKSCSIICIHCSYTDKHLRTHVAIISEYRSLHSHTHAEKLEKVAISTALPLKGCPLHHQFQVCINLFLPSTSQFALLVTKMEFSPALFL